MSLEQIRRLAGLNESVSASTRIGDWFSVAQEIQENAADDHLSARKELDQHVDGFISAVKNAMGESAQVKKSPTTLTKSEELVSVWKMGTGENPFAVSSSFGAELKFKEARFSVGGYYFNAYGYRKHSSHYTFTVALKEKKGVKYRMRAADGYQWMYRLDRENGKDRVGYGDLGFNDSIAEFATGIKSDIMMQEGRIIHPSDILTENVGKIIIDQLLTMDKWAIGAWGAAGSNRRYTFRNKEEAVQTVAGLNFPRFNEQIFLSSKAFREVLSHTLGGLLMRVNGPKVRSGYLYISLNGRDLYDVSVGVIAKGVWKDVKVVEDLYVEDLIHAIDGIIG